MKTKAFSGLSRRNALKAGVMAGLAAGLGRLPAALAQTGEGLPAAITRVIPSSGEALPVIGLGTNAYGVTEPADIARCREVLQQMPALGGSVIDTARVYGESEVVIGRLLAELGNRDRYFLASKTPIGGDIASPAAVIEESFRRLQVDRIDLMQIHNFHGIDELLPALQEFRQAGRVRYVGITTSQQEQYPLMLDAMRRHRLDFIQVNYSLGNREAAREVLPLAQELGIAVLVNMPLGGRRGTLLADIGDRPLPALAREIDAGSWAQLLLKYVISHPAVTCAIPGTTRLAHVADNQKAGRGRLPDAAMRGRIEALWSEI